MRVSSWSSPEADGVLAADELLFRLDADVEIIEEQIVVGAIPAVPAAQDVGMRGDLRRGARPAQEEHKVPVCGRRIGDGKAVLVSIAFLARRDGLWGRFLTCGGLFNPPGALVRARPGLGESPTPFAVMPRYEKIARKRRWAS